MDHAGFEGDTVVASCLPTTSAASAPQHLHRTVALRYADENIERCPA